MIYDEQGNPVDNPDLTLGYLIDGTHTVHHDAVTPVAEQSHLEVVAEDPGGGMDVRRVIDVPGVEARDAWDEQVPCAVYKLYDAENTQRTDAEGGLDTRMEQVEAALIELAALMAGGDA